MTAVQVRQGKHKPILQIGQHEHISISGTIVFRLLLKKLKQNKGRQIRETIKASRFTRGM